ncbi:MAG: DUF3298 domain-containing protein [Bacteroidales bacterium]|nr:DUF3298 domain-containing protein [Bacteroidales bacterium]
MSLLKAFRFLLFLTLSTVLISCSNSNKADLKDNEIFFDSVLLKKEKFLFNDTTKSKAFIELKLVTPNSTTPEKLRNLVISCFKTSLFGHDDLKNDINILAQNYVNNYLKEYNQLEAIYLKDQDEYAKKKGNNEDDTDLYNPVESAYSYEHNTDLNIKFNKANLLSYTVQRYDYTGGAHGMTTDSCFTILLNKGRFLTQEDLFDEASLDKIATLIVKQIASNNKVDDPDKLEEQGYFSVKEIYPNGNIFATNEGITWIYNPYDIAAYAIGSVVVTLPYSDIKAYLKPQNPLIDFIN